MCGCGAEDFVFCAGALEGQLEAVVVGLEGVGAGFEGGELGFEVADVAFFAFAEGALAVGRKLARVGVAMGGFWGLSISCAHAYICTHQTDWIEGLDSTYAARFCAFRLLCAGVRAASFSSLLLRVRLARLSSTSPPMPLSTLPTCMGVAAIAGSGEPLVVGGRPWLKEKAS